MRIYETKETKNSRGEREIIVTQKNNCKYNSNMDSR